MATAKTIKITPENTGLWHVNQTEAAAKITSELLQKDLEKHHAFFNHSGFHNHISHGLLALYGAGAPPESIEQSFQANAGYQRPAEPAHGSLAEDFRDWAVAKRYLGKEKHYADFLAFFQSEIDRLGGWEQTLLEYLFKGDERSEDMLVRMFAGLLHPIIQLMYGIEWRQPAIVAMALAQAAVHSDEWLRDILPAAEKAAAASSSSSSSSSSATAAATPQMPSIVSLLDAVRAEQMTTMMIPARRDMTGREAWEAARASAEKVRVRVPVDAEELEERTAEMYHAALYAGASAALLRWPEKEAKWDFFLIHLINVCPIFLSVNAQDWIPLEAKARLLEWKIRLDLLWYAACACPELSIDRIASYEPKDGKAPPGSDKSPELDPHPLPHLRDRLFALGEEDDGHAAKLFRAVHVGRQAIERYETKAEAEGEPNWVKIRGAGTWDRIARMVVDSVEAPGPHWVRAAGDPGAWKGVKDRSA